MADLRDRIVQGVRAGALGQFLNLANRIFLVPLFLGAWGAELYGEWLLLSSLAAWITLSDMGGQVYFINRLTMLWSSSTYDAYKRVLGTALVVFMFIPALLFLLCATAVVLLPVENWIGVSLTRDNIAKIVLLLLAFQVSISLPQGLLLGLYRSFGQLPRGVMIGNLMIVMQLVFIALALYLEQGLIVVATLQTIPVIIVIFIAVHDLKKRLPEFGFMTLFHGDVDEARKALSPSLHFFGIQMSQAIAAHGSILVIGWVLGMTQVAVFATVRTMMNLARQMLGLLSHSAWPEFTRLHSSGHHEQLRALLSVLQKLTLFGTLCFVILVQYYGKEIYLFWLGDALPYDADVVKAFSIYVLLSVYWTLLANVLMAINQHVYLARWQMIFSGLGVILCYAGAQLGGLSIAVHGLIVGEVLPMLLVTMILVRQKIVDINYPVLLSNLLPVLVGVLSLYLAPIMLVLVAVWYVYVLISYKFWCFKRYKNCQ